MINLYTIFGTGFLGKNIINHLKNRNYKIFIPKKGKTNFKKNLGNIICCIGNDDTINSPKASYEANLNIVSKIIFNNTFKTFTLISSTRVYLGSKQKKVNEETLISINSTNKNFLFNTLKASAENLCLSMPNKNIKVVRMSNLFGHNFNKQTYLLPTLIRDSLSKKKINILLNKKSSKDFLHVDEAIDVLLKIIKKSKHRIYNIASGKNIKLYKVANEIKNITNCKIIYKNKKNFVKEPIIDIKKIRNEFNFRPKKDLLKSLYKIILNYKNNEKY